MTTPNTIIIPLQGLNLLTATEWEVIICLANGSNSKDTAISLVPNPGAFGPLQGQIILV